MIWKPIFDFEESTTYQPGLSERGTYITETILVNNVEPNQRA